MKEEQIAIAVSIIDVTNVKKVSKDTFDQVKKFLKIKFVQLEIDGTTTKNSREVEAKICNTKEDFSGSSKLKSEFDV